MVAVCASSTGGLACGDAMAPDTIEPTCLLHVIGRFALEPLHEGAAPLGYLPACVRLPIDRDPATELVEQVLVPMGVTVQRTDELTDFIAAARSFDEYMEREGREPAPVAGMMSARGMTIDRVRGIAEAMALFCDAAPWFKLADEVLWRISPAPATHGLRNVVVTGDLGEQVGLAFLSTMEDFVAMQVMPEVTGLPYMPTTTLWSVMAEPLSTAPSEDADLWKREGLPLSGFRAGDRASAQPTPKPKPKRKASERATAEPPAASPHQTREEPLPPVVIPAIPLPIGFTPSMRALRPTPTQLLLMETLLRGFAAADRADLRRKTLTFTVETSAGRKSLTVSRRSPSF